MKSAKLLHIAVQVAADTEGPVCEILETLFQTAAVVHEDLEAGRTRASVYVPAAGLNRRKMRAELLRQLAELDKAGFDNSQARPLFRELRPQDWAESWKRHFKPIAIGKRLLIKPSWSKRKPAKGARLIILDPGLSFGTGQHPTTRFCLEQLVAARHAETGQGFLDMGTGTGILAIAAAKLGYEPVVAFDFDSDAVRIAADNARLNHVKNISLKQADLTRLPRRTGERFDVICANLTHDLLTGERDRIVGRLKRDGRLLLAGILNHQFANVETAYREAGMVRTAFSTEGEWMSGVFRFDDPDRQR